MMLQDLNLDADGALKVRNSTCSVAESEELSRRGVLVASVRGLRDAWCVRAQC